MKTSPEFYLEDKSNKSGLDCLIGAEFSRQWTDYSQVDDLISRYGLFVGRHPGHPVQIR